MLSPPRVDNRLPLLGSDCLVVGVVHPVVSLCFCGVLFCFVVLPCVKVVVVVVFVGVVLWWALCGMAVLWSCGCGGLGLCGPADCEGNLAAGQREWHGSLPPKMSCRHTAYSSPRAGAAPVVHNDPPAAQTGHAAPEAHERGAGLFRRTHGRAGHSW